MLLYFIYIYRHTYLLHCDVHYVFNMLFAEGFTGDPITLLNGLQWERFSYGQERPQDFD